VVKAVGVDPGTRSLDLYGFDDEEDRVLVDEAISRDRVTERPSIVLDALRRVAEEVGGLDAIVAPSGYGVPLKRASEANVEELRLATFVSDEDVKRRLKIVGLREVMMALREARDLNAWFTPGVIHLPTVPSHRKANKVDMGTADKLFSAALAIKDQAELYGLRYQDASLIVLEVGFAYTSAIAVEGGEVVDGVGGTTGWVGYLGMGAMDAELAYALANTLGGFSKQLLFTGGAAYIAGLDPYAVGVEEFVKVARRGEGRARVAYEALLEGAVKSVASLLPSIDRPREVLLSGRFTRVQGFLEDLKAKLEGFLGRLNLNVKVRRLRSRAKVAKEAAEGAAIIANGLAGGRFSELVECLKLRQANGTVFDHLYLEGDVASRLKEFFAYGGQR